jgi:hypothetical protein
MGFEEEGNSAADFASVFRNIENLENLMVRMSYRGSV